MTYPRIAYVVKQGDLYLYAEAGGWREDRDLAQRWYGESGLRVARKMARMYEARVVRLVRR